MTDEELNTLLEDHESDRVEYKESIADPGKIRQAICAFANDMPNHNKPGVIFIGVDDNGNCTNTEISDQLLLTLSSMKDDGNILPLPTMSVQKRTLTDCEMAIVLVEPAQAPPVRYKGRTWIRVGPRRTTATLEDEQRLNEKRRSRDLPFDLHAIHTASVSDLSEEIFHRDYLPSAVAPEVIEQNERSLDQQLTSLRFLSVDSSPFPTVVGLLVIGKSPADFLPGAYIQFLRIDGKQLSDPVVNQKELHGPISDLIRRLDELLEANISAGMDITSRSVEILHLDYPIAALQQLTRNALIHRDYQSSNAPVRISWFSDRIEIQNPGGPFGQVTATNFGTPGMTDYRNPHLAEASKTLGFVQRFGVGIQTAQKSLEDNGNPQAEFDIQDNNVLVTIRRQS